MPMIKSVHIGAIVHKDITIKVFVHSSRTKMLYEMNCWFFDYFRSIGNVDFPLRQLPPMDDWHHSLENDTFWQTTLDDEWTVWIRSELLEF